MSAQNTIEYIEQKKAVAVMRLPEADLFDPVAEALYEGGIRVLEITMTVPDALNQISKASRNAPSDMLIGVGSILNADMAKRAVDNGAQFVVSPIMKKEIIDAAKSMGVAVMPGAFTPTEAQMAWEYGADVVKIFPADITGMNFFKAIKAPMPHLKLMPTGGVTLSNGQEWLDHGACAVGVGSALLDKLALKEKNFEQLRKNAEVLTSNFKN